jgi:hypothetical protein
MRRLAVLFLLGASIAQAQNLVQNPDFDTGTEHWEPASNATISWVADDGSPEPGSMRFNVSVARGTSTSVASDDCIAVDPSIHYDLLGAFKLIAGSYVQLFFYTFGDAACTEAAEFGDPSISVTTADGAWHDAMVSDFALAPDVGSVQVVLAVGVPYPETEAAAMVDHIGFGPTGSVPVTLQSFDVD